MSKTRGWILDIVISLIFIINNFINIFIYNFINLIITNILKEYSQIYFNNASKSSPP